MHNLTTMITAPLAALFTCSHSLPDPVSTLSETDLRSHQFIPLRFRIVIQILLVDLQVTMYWCVTIRTAVTPHH
ncbi:hypothetical protein BDR04DRAFT_786755 [Suillus decipiens]|nr:hypothetical protein BDR04DRAFT_786755 [Suillus decipiens]